LANLHDIESWVDGEASLSLGLLSLRVDGRKDGRVRRAGSLARDTALLFAGHDELVVLYKIRVYKFDADGKNKERG
jgi:hypothetical protein